MYYVIEAILIISLIFVVGLVIYVSVAFVSDQEPSSTWQTTLYSHSGAIINKWETKDQPNSYGGRTKFKTDDGKRMQISGTLVVEEIKKVEK